MWPRDWLAYRTQVSPQKIALILGDKQWRYTELNQLTDAVCQQLQADGVEAGQHVAVLMHNNLAYVCLIHAAARLGAVLVPLNTRLTSSELVWQLQQADATTLAVDETFAQTGEELKEKAHCNLFMINNQLAIEETPVPFTIHHSPFTIHHSLQAIVFTSGTTGQPKGAMISFDNHFHSAMASAYRLGLQTNDRWLSVLPLYHVGGLAVIFRSCLYGTAVILHDRFHLDTINHSLDNDQPTLISVVPTMLYRLLNSRAQWPASLRLILLGGAAAPPELVEKANQLSMVNADPLTIDNRQLTINNSPPLIATTYGLTEASSQVATQTPAETAKKPGSVGKPLLFTTIDIVDENGRSLSPGDYGEVVVSGPTVMQEYYNDPQATAKAMQNGRLHTGDIGYLDEDGDLWLVQRRSDMIVTGGENVYPAEVEEVLRGHTAVANVCVVGISDAEWGQQVTAMVQLHPEQTLMEKELLAFSRKLLAGYKQPRHIRFVTQLPLTASGKIHRKVVVEQMQKKEK
jgi:o-succinylbenzoate---CoA ligase